VSLTARDVAEILRVLEESSFDTLDLEMDGVQLKLRRSGAPAGRAVVEAPAAPNPARAKLSTENKTPAKPVTAESVAPEPDAVAVPAPLLGIYYRAPKPGEPPFVEVGDRVQADTIIGIIEVMKLMNTVRAGVAGQIVALSAPNGELVEYGQTILWVRAD
jgi:acetyl-CoA carboxylase biotin carboxyl carrier protein